MFKKRVIAYYLPQFHQIPENDKWWGAGYTEWIALKRWKPFFKGHKIRMPGKFGFYDLSDSHIIHEEYKLAKSYGVEGFCFWTYWFGDGDRLLEKPMDGLLKFPNDVKYCIAWANHSWFDKSRWLLLKEQRYLGRADYIKFFETMLPHFKSGNYILKDNKLVLSIFVPHQIPDFDVFHATWTELAKQNGFDGIYVISDQYDPTFKHYNLIDASTFSIEMNRNRNVFQKVRERLVRQHNWTFLGLLIYDYPKMMKGLFSEYKNVENFFPTIFTGWDTTPRHGVRGVIFKNFNAQTFAKHVKDIFALNFKSEFIFVKSWNEWAEGNVLEPDDQNGEKLLEAIRDENVLT
jgi:hypothetical protein